MFYNLPNHLPLSCHNLPQRRALAQLATLNNCKRALNSPSLYAMTDSAMCLTFIFSRYIKFKLTFI